MWIKLYNYTDRKYGYNIRYGGDNYKVSEESNTKNGTPVVIYLKKLILIITTSPY